MFYCVSNLITICVPDYDFSCIFLSLHFFKIYDYPNASSKNQKY
jgi:hypothetical protein